MKRKSRVQTAEAEQGLAEVHFVAARQSHCGPAVSTVSRQDAPDQETKQEAERGAAAQSEAGTGGEAGRLQRTDGSCFLVKTGLFKFKR